MPRYRCYFLDASEKICDVAFVDQATDELAKERVRELLRRSRYPIAELWLLTQLIERMTRREPTGG